MRKYGRERWVVFICSCVMPFWLEAMPVEFCDQLLVKIHEAPDFAAAVSIAADNLPRLTFRELGMVALALRDRRTDSDLNSPERQRFRDVFQTALDGKARQFNDPAHTAQSISEWLEDLNEAVFWLSNRVRGLQVQHNALSKILSHLTYLVEQHPTVIQEATAQDLRAVLQRVISCRECLWKQRWSAFEILLVLRGEDYEEVTARYLPEQGGQAVIRSAMEQIELFAYASGLSPALSDELAARFEMENNFVFWGDYLRSFRALLSTDLLLSERLTRFRRWADRALQELERIAREGHPVERLFSERLLDFYDPSRLDSTYWPRLEEALARAFETRDIDELFLAIRRLGSYFNLAYEQGVLAGIERARVWIDQESANIEIANELFLRDALEEAYVAHEEMTWEWERTFDDLAPDDQVSMVLSHARQQARNARAQLRAIGAKLRLREITEE